MNLRLQNLKEAVQAANNVGGMVADEVAFLLAYFDPADSFGQQVRSTITTETPIVQQQLDDVLLGGGFPKSLPQAMLAVVQWMSREDEVGAVADAIYRMYTR